MLSIWTDLEFCRHFLGAYWAFHPLPNNLELLTTLKGVAIGGECENAGNQHFLTSIFSFSNNVSSILETEIIMLLSCNPLLDDKILDWSKLKQIADNI